jgi:hypothetical protein
MGEGWVEIEPPKNLEEMIEKWLATCAICLVILYRPATS